MGRRPADSKIATEMRDGYDIKQQEKTQAKDTKRRD